MKFGSFVPNYLLGKYSQLPREDIKRHAKDIIHKLAEKEIRAGRTNVDKELSSEKKKKIAIWVKEYMGKVMAHRAQKSHRNDDNAPGPSDSVSTATPQLSGSTPRNDTTKDIDTPASSSRASPGMSSEFLGSLEKEGLLNRQ